ncbi:MAG: hypothetical protein N2450_03470 [bacterium]|nr:hypothetical protein [bacterium]
MKFYSFRIIFISIVILHLNVVAGERYAGEFLLGAESPRGIALGFNGHSIPDGGFISARNPSFLANLKSTTISAFHTDRYTGIVRNDYLGVAIPYEKKGVGFAIYRVAVEKIPYTVLSNPSLPLTEYNRVLVKKYVSYQEWAIWISQGFQLTPQTSLGISLKPIFKMIDGEYAIGLGIDGGSKFDLLNNCYGTVCATDVLTSPMKWSTGKVETIKPRIQTNVNYFKHISKLHANLLTIVGSEIRFDQSGAYLFSFKGGFEYTIEKIISFRIGTFQKQLLYGMGLSIQPIQIDYAFYKQELGSIHAISTSFNGDFLKSD